MFLSHSWKNWVQRRSTSETLAQPPCPSKTRVRTHKTGSGSCIRKPSCVFAPLSHAVSRPWGGKGQVSPDSVRAFIGNQSWSLSWDKMEQPGPRPTLPPNLAHLLYHLLSPSPFLFGIYFVPGPVSSPCLALQFIEPLQPPLM